MKRLLIITGSVRKQRAADGVLAQVVRAVEANGAVAQVADLRSLALPIFDSEIAPLAPGYAPEHPAVQRLIGEVAAADGVVLLVPEYNGMVSAALKNAFDWVGIAWRQTPVVAVGYNWSGGGHGGLDNIRFLMNRIGAAMPAQDTHLVFKQDISADGTALSDALVQAKLQDCLAPLLKN